MKYNILIIFLVSLVIVVYSKTNNIVQYKKYHNKALNAYFTKDYKNWLEYNKKALKIMPNNARTIYYLANAYALNNNQEEALKFLRRSVEMGFGWNADKDNDFKGIHNHPKFKKILNRISKLSNPINNSSVAYKLEERDLIPEGITYDPVKKCFYLGSLYKCKIVKIDKNGNHFNFTSVKQDGLRQITGMKVDTIRRHLWVCSEVSSLNYINSDSTELGWSGVFKFDLETGELLKKYTLFEQGKPHLFNDIVITRNGDVFLTDSRSQEIYKVDSRQDKLKVFLQSEGFGYLNGIDLSADEKWLYVADSGGIIVINTENKNFKYLSKPENVTTVGIDGLYLYKNSLIAIQNSLGSMARISKFYIDNNGKKITKSKTIEINNSNFIIPTTGTLVNDKFYYIANSQLRSFNDENNILPWNQLKPIVILEMNL